MSDIQELKDRILQLELAVEYLSQKIYPKKTKIKHLSPEELPFGGDYCIEESSD